MPAGMDTNPCLGHDRDMLIALANTVLEGKVLVRSKLWACSVYVGISLFWFYFTSDAPLPFFAALTAYDERMPPTCSFQRSPRCVLCSVFLSLQWDKLMCFVFKMGLINVFLSLYNDRFLSIIYLRRLYEHYGITPSGWRDEFMLQQDFLTAEYRLYLRDTARAELVQSNGMCQRFFGVSECCSVSCTPPNPPLPSPPITSHHPSPACVDGSLGCVLNCASPPITSPLHYHCLANELTCSLQRHQALCPQLFPPLANQKCKRMCALMCASDNAPPPRTPFSTPHCT